MQFIGGRIGYYLLRWIRPPSKAPFASEASPYSSSGEKLRTHFGPDFLEQFEGRSVADLGCSRGDEVLALAHAGAAHVLGLEIRPAEREAARERIREAGLSRRCTIAQSAETQVEAVVCLDTMEHVADPAKILRDIAGMLVDGGGAWISFGWSWYHPCGGHLFSVFPWAHLIFTEEALCRWRRDFKHDGATRFEEVDGGLNQMSIRRFESLVDASPMEVVDIQYRPIRALRYCHNRWTREWTTALVTAHLRKAP